MHRSRWRLGGLFWRLTASYVLVTLLAALTLDVALTLGPLMQEYQQTNAAYAKREPLVQAMQRLMSPQIAPYLEQAAPDRPALQDWVLLPLINGSDVPPKVVVALAAVVPVVPSPAQATALAACAATAAASARPTANCGDIAAQQAQIVLAAAPAQATVGAALAGDTQPADLTRTTANSNTLIAVPVVAHDGRPLGALLLVITAGAATIAPTGGPAADTTPSGSAVLALFLANLRPEALAFVLLASVIATLVGVLITRNLTRRLRRMTLAAEAWSQGDFSASAHDASGDELGQLARDLDAMAIQLQQLVATRQRLAVAEERNRLARDLHDSVKQQVFAGALLVGAARAQLPAGNEAVGAYLAEAEELAERTRRDLTDLIRELRPAPPDARGLAATLRDVAQEWSRRAGVAIELALAERCDAPPAVAEALARIAQEALANIARHSGARSARLGLACDAAGVELTIADDGSGFDVAHALGAGAENSAGMGLASMRERVEALGGTLRVTSGPGGTQVRASIPPRALEPDDGTGVGSADPATPVEPAPPEDPAAPEASEEART